MVIVNFRTESRFPFDRKKIREVVTRILEQQGIRGKVEVVISVVGDRKMHELNKQYRGCDETTDVLSFPLENGGSVSRRGTPDAPSGFVSPPDGILHLGDVVISYPQAVLSAAERNVLVDEEIAKLGEHGVLHLLGIHHGK